MGYGTFGTNGQSLENNQNRRKPEQTGRSQNLTGLAQRLLQDSGALIVSFWFLCASSNDNIVNLYTIPNGQIIQLTEKSILTSTIEQYMP